MDPSIAYAFGVGMVATFNPCGFAMLPAYLSYFLGLEGTEHPDDRDSVRVVGRALAVGAAMTAGFVAVFLLLGVILEPLLDGAIDRLPWITIVLGVGLVGLGIAMLAGRSISIRLPTPSRVSDSRELPSVFLFGVSYALVSISCTFALFTAAVSTTLKDESVLLGIGAFVAYALGMGLVLMVLTVAIALARQSLVRRLRGVLPYVNRVSGALLVLAGVYVVYYGWYELRVYSGDTSGGGVAGWVLDASARMTDWVGRVGPTRLGLVLALIVALVVLVAVAVRREAPEEPVDREDADRPIGTP